MKLLSFLLIFGVLPPASGANISTSDMKFRFSGTASGSIDSESFSNLPFEIHVIATSSNASYVTPEVLQILADSARVEIGGLGIGSFLIDLRLFQSPFVSFPPGGPSGSETLGLSLASGPDLLNLFHPAFAGYDLVSDLGPVFVATPAYQSRLAFNNLPSELGSLTFSNTNNVTLTATQIPEPSMLMLTFLGLGGGVYRRNRVSNRVPGSS